MVNKPKSVILITILFVVIMTFSGCTNKQTAESVTNSEGTEGIVSEFMAGVPPDQIDEAELFEVSVRISNNGEHTVLPEEVALYLLGVNPASIGLSGVKKDATTCGEDCLADPDGLLSSHYINNEWVPGGFDYVTWSNDAGGLEYGVPITSDQNLNFVVQTCYYYNTIAVTDACFSDNPYAQTTGAETCDISGSKYASNSGAPVHITDIIENPAGRNKYSFTFIVENVGGGRTFSTKGTSLDSCTELTQSKLDRVVVKDIRVGGKTNELAESCIGREVLLVDGEGQFTCRVEADNVVGDYTDIIEAVLEYGYYDQIDKQVLVKNVLDLESNDE